ncbi:family A G protein-coupled receptor-like protein [Penicillium frequentans]|nr:family A G protein-coupled receptor-like protein [Penicillium glabrum]
MGILARANDALSVNPPTGVAEALSEHGSDWLWAVTAIYAVAFFAALVPCFTTPPNKRVFHYILAFALLAGTTTYFAQASDLGWSSISQAENLDNGLTRQIFYARYINWVVGFPALVLCLGLLAGVSWTTICSNIFCAWFWVLAYLAAAYTTTVYKWGFFAFGTFTWIILAMSTLNESHESAVKIGIGRDYLILSGLVNAVWFLYPIAFGLSDGGNVIGVTGGFVFFGVLDILVLPVVSVVFLLFTGKWDYEKLNLAFSEVRGV